MPKRSLAGFNAKKADKTKQNKDKNAANDKVQKAMSADKLNKEQIKQSLKEWMQKNPSSAKMVKWARQNAGKREQTLSTYKNHLAFNPNEEMIAFEIMELITGKIMPMALGALFFPAKLIPAMVNGKIKNLKDLRTVMSEMMATNPSLLDDRGVSDQDNLKVSCLDEVLGIQQAHGHGGNQQTNQMGEEDELSHAHAQQQAAAAKAAAMKGPKK